jgi:hypothetical protein
MEPIIVGVKDSPLIRFVGYGVEETGRAGKQISASIPSSS